MSFDATVIEETQSSEESDYSNSSMASSVLTTTDYNTDDKLTPGLVSMNISNSSCTGRHTKRNRDTASSIDDDTVRRIPSKGKQSKKDNSIVNEYIVSYNPFYPYGSNPPPKGDETFVNRSPSSRNLQPRGKRQKCLLKRLCDSDVTSQHSDISEVSGMDMGGGKTPTNHTFDNTHTSFYFVDNQSDDCGSSASNNNVPHFEPKSRPFYPDLTSPQWYQAQCFDSYWHNYQQAMQWYQKHLQTVHMLNTQQAVPEAAGKRQKKSTKSSRKARATRRARNRRLSKARQRASSQDEVIESVSDSCAVSESGSEESSEQVEMEITDEMMEFFAKSQKHKMEREMQKKKEAGTEAEDVHINIEKVVSGQQAPSTSAPAEQPGVRRSAEMKVLYGTDSAMIHGMETALQLTFDRITDKCQPKLWPNMPLKISFT